LALHPDGNLLAAGDRSGTIRLWKLGREGTIDSADHRVWQAHEGTTYSLIWSNDGSRLISAGKDGRVVNWSLAALQSNGLKRFEIDWSNSFCLIPGTELLVTAGRSIVRWNWQAGREEASVVQPESLDEIAVSPDAKLVASIRGRRVLNILSSNGISAQKPSFDWNPGGELEALHFSPDSQSLVISFQPDGTEGQPEAREGRLLGPPNFEAHERIPVAGVRDFSFSPNGLLLAVLHDSGLVLWNLAARTVEWQEAESDYSRVTFSPDGDSLATGGLNRQIVIRKVRDGSIRYLLASHKAAVCSLAFTPDSRTLASASKDGVIKLWHMTTGQELLELRGPGTRCYGLEFADNGRHLLAHVAGTPGRAEIIDFQAAESGPTR
jgi:WD40 repeat protein